MYVSFDHDLADGHYDASMYHSQEAYDKHLSTQTEKTGYHCALFLKTFYRENNLYLPKMFVHSINPIGTQKIINLFKR